MTMRNPQAEPARSDRDASPARATAEPRPEPGLARRRILVACGEPHLGDAVERVLRHHVDELAPAGLDVGRVSDGLACLQDIQLARPDLVILSARLERLSVQEILRAWDAAHPGATLPVLVLSSVFGSDVPHGMSGAVVLNLPFDNADLVGVVARALDREPPA